MPEISKEQLDAILGLLDELPERIGPLSVAFHGDAAPGSRAAEERAASDHVAEPFSLSLQSIIFAGDHAFALKRVLTGPVMTFAPWTLTRSIVESCSQVLWLLDPALDGRRRVARGLNAQLTSINDSSRFIEEVPGTEAQAELAHLAWRRAQLAGVARDEGIDVKSGRGGRLLGFGESLPTITQVVRAAGYAKDYSLLSGVAHQRMWATISTGFSVVEEEVDHSPGHRRLEQSITPLHVMHLSTLSLKVIIEATYRFISFAGWEPRLFAADIDSLLDQTILGTSIRPWRR